MNERPELALMSDWMPPMDLLQFLELGDLIEFDRSSGSTVTYYHWGVYCGVEDGIKTIIHFSTEHGDFENPGGKQELKSKLLNGSTAHIRFDPYVTVVGQSTRARINNSLDGYYHPFPPMIIRDRAMAKLGTTNYHLFYNNCEQFAKWARYGRHESDQSATFTTGVMTAATVLFTGSASAAVGVGLTIYAGVKIGRKIMHRYFPVGII